jgi:hypothetical protein
MSKIAPSRVARTMAAQLWPDVQSQYRCAPGIYGFSCAGHGGLVAVVGAADLPADAVQAARDCNKIELVAVRHLGGNRYQTMTTAKYTAASLRAYCAHGRAKLYELWIGEEDCDWATIAYVAPEVLTGGQRAGYFGQSADIEYVRGCLERWNPDFLERVDTLAGSAS